MLNQQTNEWVASLSWVVRQALCRDDTETEIETTGRLAGWDQGKPFQEEEVASAKGPRLA